MGNSFICAMPPFFAFLGAYGLIRRFRGRYVSITWVTALGVLAAAPLAILSGLTFIGALIRLAKGQ
jgi:hypothetical protein